MFHASLDRIKSNRNAQLVEEYFSFNLFVVTLTLFSKLMSDKNLNDKKYNAIDPESIIDIKVNGKLYGDLRAMFIGTLIKDRTKVQIGETFNNLRAGKVANENEYQLYILLHLLENIERCAKAQGHMIKEGVPNLNEDLQDSDLNASPSE